MNTVFDSPQWGLKVIDHPEMFGVVKSTAEVFLGKHKYLIDIAPAAEFFTFLYQELFVKPEDEVVMSFTNYDGSWKHTIQVIGYAEVDMWTYAKREVPVWLHNIKTVGRKS